MNVKIKKGDTVEIISGKLEIYNGILQMPHPDIIAPLHERGENG